MGKNYADFVNTVNEIKQLRESEARLKDELITSSGKLSECYKRMLAAALSGKDCCEITQYASGHEVSLLKELGFTVEEIKDSMDTIGRVVHFGSYEPYALREYEVWMEGYLDMGTSFGAQCLGVYEACTFMEACKEACAATGWLLGVWDGVPMAWRCRLWDNEEDARRRCG